MSTKIDSSDAVKYEITTRQRRVVVDGVYVGSTLKDLSEHMLHSSDGDHTVTILPPEKRGIALLPVGAILGDQNRVYIVSVYLDARKMIACGFKIDAIKLYRTVTGVSLKEAKDAVEQNELLPIGDMNLGTAGAFANTLQGCYLNHRDNSFRAYDGGPLLYAERV